MSKYFLTSCLLLLLSGNSYGQPFHKNKNAIDFFNKLIVKLDTINVQAINFVKSNSETNEKKKLRTTVANYYPLRDSTINYIYLIEAKKNEERLQEILTEYCNTQNKQASINSLLIWSNNKKSYNPGQSLITDLDNTFNQLSMHLNSLKTKNDYNDPMVMMAFISYIDSGLKEEISLIKTNILVVVNDLK